MRMALIQSLVVTRKITTAIAKIKAGIQDKVYLGNLDANRDWGYAPEYVEAMFLMLQQDNPCDLVIATGETHTIREFAEKAFGIAGYEIEWNGECAEEKGIDKKTGKTLIEVDPKYFRPTEVDVLLGDSSKAQRELGWKPRVTFHQLIDMMVEADLELAKKEKTLLDAGYKNVKNPIR